MNADDPYKNGPPPPPRRGGESPGESFDAIDRSSTLVYDASADPAADEDPDATGPLTLPEESDAFARTGFIPSETFSSQNKLQAIQKPGRTSTSGSVPAWLQRSTKPKTIALGKHTIRIPAMTLAEAADPKQRLLYAGGGLVAGVFFGGLLGILNALFQGWTVPQGTNQIFFLAIFLGLIFAPMAALRPSRVDRLLARIGISDD